MIPTLSFFCVALILYLIAIESGSLRDTALHTLHGPFCFDNLIGFDSSKSALDKRLDYLWVLLDLAYPYITQFFLLTSLSLRNYAQFGLFYGEVFATASCYSLTFINLCKDWNWLSEVAYVGKWWFSNIRLCSFIFRVIICQHLLIWDHSRKTMRFKGQYHAMSSCT